MGDISFEFKGVSDVQLLVTVLLAVALALAAFGVRRLTLRQWRYGLLCLLAAAFAPAIAAAVFLFGSSGPAPWFWMVLIGVQVALAVGIFDAAVYAYLGAPRITALMVLRCLAILSLLLILFQPVLNVLADRGGAKPYLPVLVARSASMATADEAYMPIRYLQAVQMLNSQRNRIEKTFRCVYYHFGESLAAAGSLDELGELEPAGEGTERTNIAKAIRDAAADFNTRDLPGMFLLSDGIHNAQEPVIETVRKLGVPIYTVGLGAAEEKLAGQKNLQIVSVDAPMDAVINNVTKIAVAVKMTGLADTEAEVQLLEEGSDEPVATQRIRPDKNVETKTVKLAWTPREPPEGAGAKGMLRKLRVVVQANPVEIVTEDNEAELHILLTQPRIRVLYIEGSIRPEYKYVRRFLASDPNVQFASLIRIDRNRFWSYGRLAGRKLDQLPTSDEDFKLFDVLIIGDLDRTFLEEGAAGRLARIRRFVKDGGGLLMLGGRANFGPGGYDGTDVEAALPVLVGPRSQAQETGPFGPQLTTAGRMHPIFEGISGYFTGPRGEKPDRNLPSVPPLLGCVRVVRAKPAAAVLAVHPTRSNEVGPLIVLAVQQFGAGRSAAFTADTTGQSHMRMVGMGVESPFKRFWGQMVRWLADVRTKTREAAASVLLRTQCSFLQVGQKIKLVARVQDQKGRGNDTAQVSCRLVSADGKGPADTLPMQPGLSAGYFETQFRPLKPGRYQLEVHALDTDGKSIGSDKLPMFVAPFSPEKANLARDEILLQLIAGRSGGRYADIVGLPDLMDHVIQRQKHLAGPEVKPDRYPLFNLAVLFFVFVGLLTGEWLLRRRWQLH